MQTSSDKSSPNRPTDDEIDTFHQILGDFMEVMQKQTSRNWHKGGREAWLGGIDKYLQEAQQNLAELRIALAYGNDVAEKAADVANDMFYIYDSWTNLPPMERGFTGE